MEIKVLNRDAVEQEIGYRPFTTFWEDFSIADAFGVSAVKDTYNSVYNSWNDNYKYWTELVLILNWKIHDHYKSNNIALAQVYDELWYNARNHALDTFTKDEKQYFYEITD